MYFKFLLYKNKGGFMMLNKNQVAFYKTSIDDREYIYKYYVLETSKEMAINNKNTLYPVMEFVL